MQAHCLVLVQTFFIFFALFCCFALPFLPGVDGVASCTGESPNACGILPSTYSQLAGSCASSAAPCPYTCECTIGDGFDRCGICAGPAEQSTPIQLSPTTTLPYAARLGGSVATWNGSVALSQHVAQNIPPVNPAPVITFNLDHTTGEYNEYVLPYTTASFTDSTTLTSVPLGLGYGLYMSENYLFVGSHYTTPRASQLWVRNPTGTPPWTLVWSASDPCPGTYHYFGFSGSIDERVPQGAYPGNWGVVAVGDPAAYYSGRVYIYFTYSLGILQELYIGFGNATSAYCFGESVSSDSGWLVVGAPAFTNEALVSKCGAVYVYKWDSTLGVQGEYAYFARIDPLTPTTNGGFGESVSVYENFVMVGDNAREAFIFMLSGSSYITMNPVQQPTGVNANSRLGYTVSMWDQFALAGDENFVPIPTAFGTTFVWDRNPTSTNFWRHVYDLYDTSGDLLTYYGASVSIRGGCMAVSGAPLGGNNGVAYLVDLCRDDCYGCDGVLNSCVLDDACGVCDGDNSTCLDCFNVINGPAREDLCGVCNGTNSSCVVFEALNLTVPCNSTVISNLSHAFESQLGVATWTLVSPFASLGLANIVNGRLLTYIARPYYYGVDTFGVKATLHSGVNTTMNFTIIIETCEDCDGVFGGPSHPDACGVCDGDNSTCLGCDGVPNSGVVYDYCGVCGGAGNTCVYIVPVDTSNVTCTSEIIFQLHTLPTSVPVSWSIIDGPIHGTAGITQTGVFQWINALQIGWEYILVRAVSKTNPSIFDVYNISFYINDCSDCNNVQGGTQVLDLCGVCGGNSQSCADCRGVPNGVVSNDACGVCGGNGNSCRDCFNVQNGGAIVDLCGVCGGSNECIGVDIGPVGYILFSIMMFVFVVVTIACLLIAWMSWGKTSGWAVAAGEQDYKNRRIAMLQAKRIKDAQERDGFVLNPQVSYRPQANPAVDSSVLTTGRGSGTIALQDTIRLG